jgi:hypothetical protein
MEAAEVGEEIRNGAGRTEWNPHTSLWVSWRAAKAQ